MLPILGQPIVERVMETLWDNEVRDFILVVSPDDRDIVRYFTDESPLRGHVAFVEQAERLGMAHALGLAAPLIHDTFVLSACDNLVADEHVGRLIAAHTAVPDTRATLTLMHIAPDLIGRTGIVELNGEWVIRIVEKPRPEEARSNIASLPLYVFSPRILDYLPEVKRSARGEYELQDAIQMLIERDGGVRGVFTDSRLTLTGPEDLLVINSHYLLNGSTRPHLSPYTVGPNTQLITPLRIEPGTTIGADCIIGPRVYVERDATIGVGVTLRDAVVLRGAVVPAGAHIVGQVVS
jgi:UDP-N-acetylglucosamine diphosphorylase / glucose-1-phosphate thymidylyltransferase / UDP-N-acetylgalactosamine diphosphorylase / glucosamine-1-phosphate N-acetyltransferase / galactosamine-1-phosphate N-acetyltransferase